jgi:hypothetical protein
MKILWDYRVRLGRLGFVTDSWPLQRASSFPSLSGTLKVHSSYFRTIGDAAGPGSRPYRHNLVRINRRLPATPATAAVPVQLWFSPSRLPSPVPFPAVLASTWV